jgi:orotidine-5'-phosphate decarboxylase
MPGFNERLDAAVEQQNSLLCVGLDPVMEKLPEHLRGVEYPFFEFSKGIIDATAEFACAIKPNKGFFAALGESAATQTRMTIEYAKATYPWLPVIYDAKEGDIDSTNVGYVKTDFDFLGSDAVTIHPYLGWEANTPFLDQADKGIIVLCRTSNKGSGEFQDKIVEGKKLFLHVAEHVADPQMWNYNGNCLVVAGATYPEEVGEVRAAVGDELNILVPGIGAQGGDLERTLLTGLNSKKKGLIISASRSIIYASAGTDFAEAAAREARKLRDDINQYRKAAA